MASMRKVPYRNYIVGSLLRGKSLNSILLCLRNIGMTMSLDPALIAGLSSKELLLDAKTFQSTTDELSQLEIASRHEVNDYIFNFLNNTQAWTECWDLISVRKYREYIFILASIPGYTHTSILEMFNKKFSREISKDGITLLISLFWNIKGLSTLDIKNATDSLLSQSLKDGINKLLFGNAVAAAKSVGVSLKLNYALILEEMLSDAYLKYQDAVIKNADLEKIDRLRNAIMKIGDRVEKMGRKDSDVDVLHNLLSELKITVESRNPKLSEFLKENDVI